jgi:hypothetical protein
MFTPDFGLVPYGYPTVVALACLGLRPVNVAFSVLIFILFLVTFSTGEDTVTNENFDFEPDYQFCTLEDAKSEDMII